MFKFLSKFFKPKKEYVADEKLILDNFVNQMAENIMHGNRPVPVYFTQFIPKQKRIRKCIKTSYTKKVAQIVKNKREYSGSERLRVYHCPKCNMWHLTHQPKYDHSR